MTDNHELTLKTRYGNVSLKLVRKGRRYQVTEFVLIGNEEQTLAFDPESPGFENLDTTSDSAQVFNISHKVRYGSVVLGTLEMVASSFEELKDVLSKVKMRAYSPEEI